jgi:hypothetical protein
MTSPVWSQLVSFSATNPADSTGLYPVLREEVKTGKVQLQVDLDGELVVIPVKEMRFPWAVSLDSEAVGRELAQDLFYGIDNGSRTSAPTPNDSLVKSRIAAVHLIFKDSPLLTEARKVNISKTIDGFYFYLTGLGFTLEKDFPPIGVSSTNVFHAGGGSLSRDCLR